jgi:hypothetical protein
MIVIFQKNKLNSEAALLLKQDSTEKIYYYPDVHFSTDENDRRLIILDLTADAAIQDQFGLINYFQDIPHLLGEPAFRARFNDKSRLADIINTWGLPKSIKTIDLCVSEVKSVTSYDSLYNIASHLTARFQNKYKTEITVRISADDRYDYTFITPPEKEEKEFKIYGIQEINFKPTFESFLAAKNKVLIWAGKDLNQWFSNPDRHITPPEVKAKSDSSVESIKKRKRTLDKDKKEEVKSSPNNKLKKEEQHSSSVSLSSSAKVSASLPSLSASPRTIISGHQSSPRLASRKARPVVDEMLLLQQSEELKKQDSIEKASAFNSSEKDKHLVSKLGLNKNKSVLISQSNSSGSVTSVIQHQKRNGVSTVR